MQRRFARLCRFSRVGVCLIQGGEENGVDKSDVEITRIVEGGKKWVVIGDIVKSLFKSVVILGLAFFAYRAFVAALNTKPGVLNAVAALLEKVSFTNWLLFGTIIIGSIIIKIQVVTNGRLNKSNRDLRNEIEHVGAKSME